MWYVSEVEDVREEVWLGPGEAFGGLGVGRSGVLVVAAVLSHQKGGRGSCSVEGGFGAAFFRRAGLTYAVAASSSTACLMSLDLESRACVLLHEFRLWQSFFTKIIRPMLHVFSEGL